MGDVASPQYPGAPPPSQGLLQGDPARAVGLLGQIQDFQIRQQQAPALGQIPAASLAGQHIANATAQQAQEAAATATIRNALATSLAGNPSPTADDVHSAIVNVSRANPHIAVTMPGIINAQGDFLLKDGPKGIKTNAGTLLNMGLSPEGASIRVTGPPGPGGAPTSISVPQANQAGPQGIPTGLAPGESELLGNPSERAAKLQSTASTTAQYHADLDNLKQESKVLDIGGPTVEFEKKANQFLTRIGLPNLGTMSPDQLKSAEGFDKIANQISLNQSQFFHGSDAGLHTVVGANPSSSMSRYGREGVIDMLQGNQDAIDRARKIWLDARAKGAPVSSHDQFMDQLSEKLDPRVFQFNRMSRDNQQKFLGQMDPDELGDFEQKYQAAIAQKWVKPLKKATNAP